MATTPLQPYNSLSLEQKVQYAKNVAMANYGVTQPNVTALNTANLDRLIKDGESELIIIKQDLNNLKISPTYQISFYLLPPQVQTILKQYVPPGYAPPASISFQQIADLEQGVINSLQALKVNPAVIPAAGSGVSTQPLQPAAPTPTQPNNDLSTLLTVGALGLGAVALLNSTTPPQAAPTIIPTPPTPTPPIENTLPATTTPTTNPVEQTIDFSPLQEPPATTDGDEFAGIDEQIQRQKDLENGSLEFAGIDQQIAANENTLQEPPQLSDEEVTAYFQNLPSNDYDITNVESENPGVSQGLSGPLAKTRGAATNQDASNFQQKQDWRVRLSLAPGSTYLYNNTGNEGILLPLAQTNGVIFPYTPAISVAYSAAYEGQELTHSNYKFFSYRASSVDSISITCDFTAQDTFEANYLLAVIHFFRSVTKMFYGQDQNPKPGTPPPLCYLTGLGAFQFDEHPLAITGFTYSLPTDVDYIRAGVPTTQPGVNKGPAIPPKETPSSFFSKFRLQSSGLQPGALAPPVYFTENAGTREPTYVPTKIQMAITAVPIVTRNDISNNFSLKEYGTGKLLRGSRRSSGGGIW
jgi:hypothetical protein